MDQETGVRQEIVEAGRRLYQKGMVAANDGNISARLSGDRILITPTGICKGDLEPDQLVLINSRGNQISGRLKPTSEMKMHLTVYQNRPDVRAIVHAHPQKATAFAACRKNLDQIILPEAIFTLGEIRLVDYATPSTDDVPNELTKQLAHAEAFLLSNHGALTLGTSVMKAYFRMETLEHYASIILFARICGDPITLRPEQVERLYEIRRSLFSD
jgi:L-fuculose-phosphate aldolase